MSHCASCQLPTHGSSHVSQILRASLLSAAPAPRDKALTAMSHPLRRPCVGCWQSILLLSVGVYPRELYLIIGPVNSD